MSRDTEESLETQETTETSTEKAEEIAGEEEKEEPVAEEASREEIKEEVKEEAEKERKVTEEKEKRKEEAEEEIVEERVYTIPLRRAWISPRKKRAPRAVRIMRNFIQRHMKLEPGVKEKEGEETGRLVISNEVNEKLWGRGIEKPPRKIRVRAVKDKEGTVTLYLAEGD